jgi:hypothetical protein
MASKAELYLSDSQQRNASSLKLSHVLMKPRYQMRSASAGRKSAASSLAAGRSSMLRGRSMTFPGLSGLYLLHVFAVGSSDAESTSAEDELMSMLSVASDTGASPVSSSNVSRFILRTNSPSLLVDVNGDIGEALFWRGSVVAFSVMG